MHHNKPLTVKNVIIQSLNGKTALLLVLYTALIFSSPMSMSFLYNCIGQPTHSYTYQECNISQALHIYTILILSLTATLNIIVYLVNGHLYVPRAITVAIVSTIIATISFYWYIPQAQLAIDQVPIILSPASFQ